MNVSGTAVDNPAEQLTDRAHRALDRATAEAQRLGQPHVCTEHLLLALVDEPDGTADRVLRQVGVEPASVRHAIEFVFGSGTASPAGVPATSPLLDRVVKRAAAEARRLSQPAVDDGHLRLALLREGGRAVGFCRCSG